jgi:hypothetical protein
MHPRTTVEMALTLSALGLIDDEVARICGVSLGAVRKWRTAARDALSAVMPVFINTSKDILALCGEALDLLGVEWRFSKPTTISVARRDAVARLDAFVGPKY